MKKFFTALLIPALLIGITPRYSVANTVKQYPGVYPGEEEEFLREQSKSIFIALECLRRGGATPRQSKEYLMHELKKYNISLSEYQKRMTKENQNTALKSLSKYKPLIDGASICELRIMETFNKLEDYRYLFAVVDIEKNLGCINKLRQVRDDVTEGHVAKWLADKQQESGVKPAVYSRLLNDKLMMPKHLVSSRKVGCSYDDQKVALSLFLKNYIGDSSTYKIPLNQLTASDFKTQHQRCKDVKDYQGCMNYKNNVATPTTGRNVTSSQDYCPDKADGWCIAGEGRDRFDLKKMKGWQYKEFEDGHVLYFDPVIRRVPHKKQPHRYIARTMLSRFYEAPTAGTPGSYSTIGSATTDCTDYGSSISCTTNPPTQIYIPGISGTAGGIKSIKKHQVVDCEDKTYAFYKYGKLDGGWNEVDKEDTLYKYCSNRSTLPMLEMKL